MAPAATGAGAGVGEAGAYGTSGYGATTTGAATEGVTETRAGTVEVPVVQQVCEGRALLPAPVSVGLVAPSLRGSACWPALPSSAHH